MPPVRVREVRCPREAAGSRPLRSAARQGYDELKEEGINRTSSSYQTALGRAPPCRIDGRAMGAQLHHWRARAAHIEDLDVAAVLVESAHVIRVARIERDA